jgi:hypothetical protein
LQYTIELGGAGLFDSTFNGSTSDPSILSGGSAVVERLSALVRFQARWRSFNPSSQSTHTISDINVERFVYNEGVLTVSYHDETTGEFRILSWNTSIMANWSIVSGIITFETHPSQNLLLLVEYVPFPLCPRARRSPCPSSVVGTMTKIISSISTD